MFDNSDDVSLDALLSPTQVRQDEPTDLSKNNPPASDDTGGNQNPNSPASTDDNSDKVAEQEFKTLLSSFISEDNLEEEDKQLRQELLTKYKGTSFDVNGNLVDEQGNVKVPFDTLLKEVNEEGYTLDKEGNQIDASGAIVKTAYELAVENTVVNKLASETGYELLDENGNPKIYTDDDEGFKALTNDISIQRFQEFKEEFFNQNPTLAEVAKHLLSGNSLSTFQEPVDYASIDVKELSDSQKEQYIRKSLEVKNIDKTQIDALVKLFKDSNSLTDQAIVALPALQAYEQERIAARDRDYQKTIEDRNKEIEEYWQKAEAVVNKGQLSNITIPEADRKGFYDYISTAVDDRGNSKEMLDRNKETLEQQLAYSYLRYKGFDLSKLVKTEVQKTKIASLKDRIRRSSTIKDSPLNDANVGVTSGGADVTLDKLLGQI